MINYPNIDPILVSIGPIHIRWYGLAYIIGILTAMRYLRSTLTNTLLLSKDQQSSLMIYVLIGIILGGRFGYIIFYDLNYYLANPLQWLAVWNGGMSYHGGGIGAVIAVGCFARNYQKSFLLLLDVLGIGTTFGLFLGRIANFINAELYGRVTDVPWGMIFPNAGPLPRHPSQLYEAFFEGVILFIILHVLSQKKWLKPGQLFGVYWVCYGLFRFIIEFFRQPDAHLGTVLGPLSMGQVLCGIMIIGGGIFIKYCQKHTSKTSEKIN